MLEGVLAGLLNRFIGQYVENLEQNQLDIAVWKGDVVLRNLRLKREALDKFNFPVDVVEGYLGELTLNIPWSDLGRSAVRVNIKDLFLLAGPKAESDYDAELEEKRSHQAKMNALGDFDNIVLNKASTEAKLPAAQQETFVGALVTKILDNLQVTIENIHVRYEDKTSNPSHPFSAGISLSVLSAESTNEDWEPQYLSGDIKVIHKLLKLGSLAIYFNTDAEMVSGTFNSLEDFQAGFKSMIATQETIPDYQYVLRPVSGVGKVRVNKQPSLDAQPNKGEFQFEEFALVLDDHQYANLMMLLAGFTKYSMMQKYRKYRPATGISPKSDPRAWWKYLRDIYVTERRRKWSWKYFRERRDDRVGYVALWKKFKLNTPLSPEEMERMEELEAKLSLEDLKRYHWIAIKEIKKENKGNLLAKERGPPPATSSSSSMSWLTSWWGGSSQGQTASAETEATVLTDSDISVLYASIDFDPTDVAEGAVFPPEYVNFIVEATLLSGSVNLKRRIGDELHSLISLVFDDLKGAYLQRPNSFVGTAALGNMSLHDGSTPNSLYPLLLSAKQSKDMKSLDRKTGKFFQLKYEQYPLDKTHGDHYIEMELLPVEYVHNPLAIKAVTKFFSRPESENDTVDMIKLAAEDTLKGITSQTRAGFESILLQRKTTVLNIKAEAPIIVVPENVTDDDATIVILDMGKLTVESDPVDAALKEDILSRSKTKGEQLAASELERLKMSMFDRYHCMLSSVQVVTGRSFVTCVEQLVVPTPDPAYHVFDRIDLKLLLETCILPHDVSLPRLRLTLNVGRLHLNFSDRKYKRIMRAIQILIGRDDAQQPSATSRLRPKESSPPNPAPIDYAERERRMRSRSVTERLLPRSFSAVVPGNDSPLDLPDDLEGFVDAPEAPVGGEDGATDPALPPEDPAHVVVDFALNVESMSATVRRTDRLSIPETQPGTELATLSVLKFRVEVKVRPLDLLVGVFIGKVSIIDKMHPYGKEFDVLLESLTDTPKPGNVASSDWFVEVQYRGINKNHREYAQVDHDVEVSFASVNLMLTPESILEIQDFVLVTFAVDGPPGSAPGSTKVSNSAAPSVLEQENSADGPKVPTGGLEESSTIKVAISMNMIALSVNRRGALVATGSIGQGSLSMTLGETMFISGKLGSFTIEDCMRRRDGFAQFVSFAGDQVANFTFQTYNPRSPDFPGYDSLMKVTTESVRIVYLDYLLSALLEWLSDVSKARAAMEAARRSAANSAAYIQEATGRFCFEVNIKTPIVVLPRPLTKSQDMVEAYLGEITCSNKFLDADGAILKTGTEGRVINKIDLKVRAMKLVSTMFLDSANTFKQQLPIIRNIDWDMELRFNEGVQDRLVPAMEIVANLGDATMQMTEKQYALILEILDGIIRSGASKDPQSLSVDKLPGKIGQSSSESLVRPAEASSSSLFASMDVSVSISTLGLDIFTADSMDEGESALSKTGLGQFLVNGILINAALSSTSDIAFEVVLNSVTLRDTRADNPSVFKEVVPSNKYGKNKLVLQFSRGSTGATDVVLSLDGLQSILSLPYVFDLWNFFMVPKYFNHNPAAEERLSPAPSSLPSASSPQDVATPSPPFTYRINVVDAEIIVLGDPTVKDTEAVMLYANQLLVVQDSATSLSLKQAYMYLINMERRQETKFRLVSAFDATLRMDVNPDGTKIVSSVSAQKPLEMRISYRDFALFSKLFSLMTAVSGANPAPNPTTDTSVAPTASSSVSSVNPPIGKGKPELFELAVGGLEVVLIDDVTDPMIQMINIRVNPIILQAKNWSNALVLSLPLGIAVNYFNVKNSHWEPLVEPWKCSVQVSKASAASATEINFTSSAKLDINVTQVFLETLSSTLSSIGNVTERNLQQRRSLHAPFLIRNRTGYDMTVWADNVLDGDGANTVLKELPNNNDTRYKFVDWKRMREAQAATANLLSVQLKTSGSPWETLKSLPVNSEGTTSYVLRPKINNVSHRLAVDVKLRDNIKYVTLRSTFVIRNDCLIGIELILKGPAKEYRGTYRIAPGTEFSVPILYVADSSLQVRPEESFGYDWCREIVHWSSLRRAGPSPRLTCLSTDHKAPMFRFSLFSKFHTDASDNYPELLLSIAPPMELENLLPYNLRYTLFVRPKKEEFREMLLRGKISPIHTVEPTDALALALEIPETGHKSVEVAILSKAEISYRDDKVKMRDPQGRDLLLRLKYNESKSRGTKITLYSPFVMVNRTSVGLFVKPSSGGRNYVAGSDLQDASLGMFMFSFADAEFEDQAKSAVLRVGDSAWSKPVVFDPVGSAYALDIPTPDGTTEAHVGLSIKEGEGKYYLTKVVTIASRFILRNNLDVDLLARQQGTSDVFALKSGQRLPVIHFVPQDKKQRTICIRLAGTTSQWSSQVKLDDIGTTYVKMGRAGSDAEDLLRMEAVLQDATVHVIFSREEGRWPFLIDNSSSTDVTLYQYSINNAYKIPKGKTLNYAWDSPSVERRVLMVVAGNTAKEVNIIEIGPQPPFKYHLGGGRVGTMSIDIRADGPTTVVKLTDYDAETSLFKSADKPGMQTPNRPRESPSVPSAAGSDARAPTPSGDKVEDAFEAIDIKNPVYLKFVIDLSFLGISFINADMKEIIYASWQMAKLTYVDRALDTSYEARLGWVQIDNQLPDSVEPIILYPTQISKEFDENQPPLLTALLVHLKDRSYGVDYFKALMLAIQEISLELDEDSLRTLQDMFKFAATKLQSDDVLFEQAVDLPEPSGGEGDKLFFELLSFAPVKVNLSFTRTDRGEIEEMRRARGAMALALDVLTTTIGNVHDAPIQLNMLELNNARGSLSQLLNLASAKYKMEITGQIHKLIGSADFLGNPVGLFNTVSSGVVDMFYEPLQGFSLDRPEDFGTGFAKGAKSFARKTVYGFSDTFSKVTGSFGKGLAVVTMDEEFVARRSAYRLKRNRPKNALGGVASGLKYLGSSVASGVAGVFTKPIEGARADSALGFGTGLVKGVIGLFAKPVVGMIDVSNQLFEGIKSTTTDVSEIDRVRLPRFIGRDKVLRPYDAGQARGLNRLRAFGPEYVAELYVAELELDAGKVAILTELHLIVGKTETAPVEWQVNISDIVTVRLSRVDILVSCRSRTSMTRVLNGQPAKLSETAHFFAKLEHIVSRYQHAARRE